MRIYHSRPGLALPLTTLTLVLALLPAGCGGPSRPVTRLTPLNFVATSRPAALGTNGGEATPAPASRPAAPRGPVVSLGGYMVVGAVLAEANGQPIYADKVLAKLEDVLAAKARELQPRQFRSFAQSMILQQVDSDIRDELEFAAAQRFTTAEDQQMASVYTMLWRQREITRNGGSEALTRERYLHPPDPSVPPMDFDDKVKEQYRRHLVMFYYQRRVWPRVQVSAEDMRRFYDRNKDALFTVKSAVLFRVIRIGVQESGSREAALRRIEGLLDRARRGEDFGLLASANNDNRSWRSAGGFIDVADKTDADGNTIMRHPDGRTILRDKEGFGVIRNADGDILERSKELLEGCTPVREPRFVERGTLRVRELEDAIFALERPGQLTSIIDGGDGFYLAELVDRQVARELAFDDAEVQTAIRNRLEAEQRQQLRQREQKKLLEQAVWRRDASMIELAADMAVQRFYGAGG